MHALCTEWPWMGREAPAQGVGTAMGAGRSAVLGSGVIQPQPLSLHPGRKLPFLSSSFTLLAAQAWQLSRDLQRRGHTCLSIT